MQFSCASCSTKYSVPDEKVRGKRLRTRCKKCGAEIVVDGPKGASPSLRPGAPDGTAAPAARAPAVLPPMPKPAPGAPPPAKTDWDSDDEATRVVDGSLRFPGRQTRQEVNDLAPSSRPPPMPAPGSSRPPPRAEPITSRPPPPAAEPAPRAEVITSRPPPAPAPAPLPPLRPPPAPVVARAPTPAAASAPRAAVAPPEPPLPSRPAGGDFSFDDESTAVIAPDRAKALLEEEMARSARSAAAPPADADFSFDDEATQVISTEQAPALLAGLASTDDTPTEAPASRRPPPLGGNGAAPARVAPSVIVAQPPAAPALAGAPAPAPTPVAPALESPATRESSLAVLQNEKTRVVQRVTSPTPPRKKSAGAGFWILLLLALAAASAGGFLAAQLLARRGHSPPVDAR